MDNRQKLCLTRLMSLLRHTGSDIVVEWADGVSEGTITIRKNPNYCVSKFRKEGTDY